MSNILLVPIHVNALCLADPGEAVSAFADFKRLPFIYDGEPHQTGTPNISKQILTPLFDAGKTTLKAGIHLHWFLPDALTRGEHSATGTKFPIVPNRWLILRQGGDQGTKQWIIESDYLYPEKLGSGEEPADTINILVQRPTPKTDQYQRYRFMGRTLELSDWRQQSNLDREYTATLTAIGTQAEVPLFDYVQATFAAFYPNCQSVFGFHDRDYPTTNPSSGLQYDVIGWYGDEQQDILKTLLQNNQGKKSEELLELIQEELRWTFELDGEIPQRTLYHSRVTFGSTGQVLSASDRINSLSQPTIAVGNSAPEALSAYLAHDYNNQTNPEIRQFVQEQLEALQLSERLESGQLDLDAKLQEARHEQGFGTQSAGILWSIAPKVSDAQTYRGIFSIPNSKSQVQSRFSLPLDLGRQLNKVNRLQEEYNQALVNIESQGQQLYTHWYEFIEKYHSKASDSMPILDATESKLLNPLRTALGQTGRLEIERDDSDNFRVTAATLCFSIYSSFTYLEGCVDLLNRAVAGHVTRKEWYEYLQVEFEKCNVKLLPEPPVPENESESIPLNITQVTPGQEWRINDQGQTYTVKVENSVLNIYIPPTYIPVSEKPQLAYELATKINELIGAIATYNRTAETQYTLKQVPAAHYWQANDPVLFLAGEAAASTGHKRLQSGEFLQCHQWNATLDLQTLPEPTITSIQNQINNLAPQPGEEDIGFNHWRQQPWIPFLMQWAVQAFPCRPDHPNPNYNPEIILDNYQLERNAIDLTLKTGSESSFVKTANTYQGLSILTPAANFILEERLIGYLNEELLPQYYSANNIPEEQQTEDYLSENFQAIASWYRNSIDKTEIQKAQDPIWVTLWAYEQMQTLEGQAQAIAGFNDTLLLYRPTLYLEIDDPLLGKNQDVKDIKFFHEQVRWTLGYTLQYEILKLDIFNPIRSGALKITTLWLVDTFGQFKKVVESGMNTDVVTTIQMTPPNPNYQVLLPPRLAQPARLNFHWIVADSQKEEQLTAAPAITPVCGWIVPNNLDSNLEFYDTHGQALGLIDRAGTWRPTPGKTTSFNPPGYSANLHLNKVVDYLLNHGRDFQQKFISTLINSLDNIAPENFAEHPSLALLIGRPIAVVRATFNLEVQGLPTVDPSLSITDSNYPTTRGFDAVKFPIHLGDYQQFNDGLVGYWREVHQGESYVYEDNIFYAPQSNSVNNNLIKTEAEGIVFEQTVDAPPQFVTMLIDPRGTIHAKSGILPNRELRLSPENYDEALKAIEVHFLSTPVLSNQGEIIIPLPEIPQYAWSWLSRNSSGWLTSDIEPVNFNATFAAPQELYEGWLQLTPAEEGEE
ncbi:hypothetical protein IQ276_025715 [Desmonostoc muscorum LEGE 12446]|uniref:Uncharacterized protein n=1 Tax=Desmonostoc muscorum LEGE 12446 TaxID=1828758 RepID=A0A8J6ZH83_DESMC|nr:hypothetical protein [Desmonostoc muscorum]MCF2149764.1 hypothetical protein [Desmonostoc muscorum LEGE 12446]